MNVVIKGSFLFVFGLRFGDFCGYSYDDVPDIEEDLSGHAEVIGVTCFVPVYCHVSVVDDQERKNTNSNVTLSSGHYCGSCGHAEVFGC